MTETLSKVAAAAVLAAVMALAGLGYATKPTPPKHPGWTISAYPWSENPTGAWQVVKLSEVPVD